MRSAVLNTRLSAHLRSYPGLTTFDADLIYESTLKDGQTRVVKVKSPSGDVLEGVAQVLLPSLVGLVHDSVLVAVHDHLAASALAQRVTLTEDDLQEYSRLTASWMSGYHALGGVFNVRSCAIDLFLTL